MAGNKGGFGKVEEGDRNDGGSAKKSVFISREEQDVYHVKMLSSKSSYSLHASWSSRLSRVARVGSWRSLMSR